MCRARVSAALAPAGGNDRGRRRLPGRDGIGESCARSDSRALVRGVGVGGGIPSTSGRPLGARSSGIVDSGPLGDVRGDLVRVDAGLLLAAIRVRSQTSTPSQNRSPTTIRSLTATHAGGFEVHHLTHGQIGGNVGCDVGFWITGFPQGRRATSPTVSGCPKGDFPHLAGDWWELEGNNHHRACEVERNAGRRAASRHPRILG